MSKINFHTFNNLKGIPDTLKGKGYSAIKSIKDLDNTLVRSRMKALLNQFNMQSKLMSKVAKINGAKIPVGLTDESISPEAILPQYEQYVREKAYEPKSKWRTTTIFPALLGTALAQLAFHNKKVQNTLGLIPEHILPATLGVGAAVGAIGGSMKLMDDSKIRTSREISKDPEFSKAVLDLINIRRHLAPNVPTTNQFLENPSLKNVRHIEGMSGLMGSVGLPTS